MELGQMKRIRLMGLAAGLVCLSPACGGHANGEAHNDVPMGGKVGVGGMTNPQGAQGHASGGAPANGGAPVSSGAPAVGGAVDSVDGGAEAVGGDSSTSGGGVDATAGHAGAGGSGGLHEDTESSMFGFNARTQLDGFMFLPQCVVGFGARDCSIKSGACPAQGDDLALSGVLLTDRTLQLGGNPELTYEVVLHIQGIAESRTYRSGVDQLSSGDQVPADGFYTDGDPSPGNARSVFMIRVGEPAHDYFLNSLATATDDRLRSSVFPVDYMAKIRIQGGTTVRLVHADSNCVMALNCDDSEQNGCIRASLPNLDPKLAQTLGQEQPYDGQFLGLRVVDITIAN